MRTVKESSTNQLNKKEILQQCPIAYTLDKIGGRWKLLILWQLKNGKLRYSELKRAVPQISEKMLIQQLRDLEEDKFVLRKAKDVVPPFVEYSMTKKAGDLMPLLDAIAVWGLKYR